MGTAALQLTEVSISRGHKTVLSGLNLSVEPSEILAVLGASGRGKTSLLHAIAGLIEIDSGEISKQSKQPGVAFQDSLLLPWLTVRQNVALSFQFKANYLGANPEEVTERIERILLAVGISELQQSFPDQLSGGQAQRVSIARALAANPQLLLLDEPFSALDAITRSQLHKLIRDTRDLLATTIVLVTHDISEALAIADRLVVLADKDRTLELRPETEKQTEQEAQILLALGGNYVI